MEYFNIYFDLIDKHGHAVKPPVGYYERHHITPKALGGDDSEANLTYVSGRVHFLAHWLLYKATNDPLMARAFYGMCDTYRRPERKAPTARQYQSAKEAFSAHNHMKLPEHQARAAESAKNQWRDRYDEMKASNSFMFEDKDHPMYMKGKTGFAHPRSRPVFTPMGVFGSVREAAKALGIPHPAVSARCKSAKWADYGYCA